MKTNTIFNATYLFFFGYLYLILLIFANIGETFPQSLQSYSGSYVKTTIKSADTYYPNPFPVFLTSPKDTVLSGNSNLTIPFIVNYFDASFNGNFLLDFPSVTPPGLWETNYSNTSFTTPLMLPVRLTGTLTLPAASAGTTYLYSIQIISPYSLLSANCSTAVKEVSDYKASPGTYNIDLTAICPIFILDHTNYYDYWAGSRFRFRFYPRISFTLLKAGSTYSCNFGSSFETEYLFQRIKPPYLSVSPSSVELQTSTSDSARTKTLTISNYGSDTLDFNSVVSTANGINWLTISKNSGLLKGSGSVNLFLKLDPGTLRAGTYNGSVTFSSVKAENTPIVIPVTMTLTSNRLLLKYDPPEIKLGEWTSLNISIIDQDSNLVDTYDGGATVNLLSETKEGLTNFSKTQTVLISKGKAQPLLLFTPDKSKPFDSVVTNTTVLSGPIVIEARPEDSPVKPDTAKIAVKSPIDFYIDSIEVQQGIANSNKEVTLEYGPGVQKTYPARSFVAGHNTVVRAFIKYKKTTDINFNRIEYKIKGNLYIAGTNMTLGPFSMGWPGMIDNPSPITQRDTFNLIARASMRDALFRYLDNTVFASPTTYSLRAELEYVSDFDEKESEKENNKKIIEASFQDSREFKILASTARLEGENYPVVNNSIWDYLKNVYPINNRKFTVTDPNSIRHTYSPGILDFTINFWNSLTAILNRYNQLARPQDKCELILMFTTPSLSLKFNSDTAAGVATINGKACIINTINPLGSVVAHELGHLLGLMDTYDPYKVYNFVSAYFASGDPNPRRSNADFTGNIIEDGNINWPILKKASSESVFYDFMGRSQMDSAWIDRVTWDYLYKKFILSATHKPSASGYIAVSGILKQNDTLILNNLIKMDAVPSTDETLSGSYAVEFLNSSGGLVQKNNFEIVFLITEVYQAKDVPFNLYLPLPAGTASIRITKTDSLGVKKTLASRVFSANAPIVKLILPTPKDTVKNTCLVKWSSSDADKDNLTYDLSYSPDGVKQYIVAVGLQDTLYQWNVDKFPVSNAGYISVIASDGYNDGMDKSAPLLITGVESGGKYRILPPSGYNLEQCYPNPFNPITTITYAVPVESKVKITVYNLIGQIVSVPEEDVKASGNYKIDFDAGNLPSGVYFYTMNAIPLNGAKEFRKIMKMVLLK